MLSSSPHLLSQGKANLAGKVSCRRRARVEVRKIAANVGYNGIDVTKKASERERIANLYYVSVHSGDRKSRPAILNPFWFHDSKLQPGYFTTSWRMTKLYLK